MSEISKSLDDMVSEFRTRPLEIEYPVIWVDVLYEKIRDLKRLRNMATMIVKGITLQGMIQILAVEAFDDETKENYSVLFESLKACGLHKIWLYVFDAHRCL